MMEFKFFRKWEAAHRLIEGVNQNTLCSQPHGHTWSVEVILRKKSFKQLNGIDNVMVPFQKAKSRWHQWIDEHLDHAMIMNEKDPLIEFLKKENPVGRVVITPGDPTTEMLALLMKSKLEQFLIAEGDELYCEKIILHETQTNSVIFEGSTREYFPANAVGRANAWWLRPDFSTTFISEPL